MIDNQECNNIHGGKAALLKGKTLAQASSGTIVKITGFTNCDQKIRLSNIGLGIGALVEIIANILNKPIIVFSRGARLAVARKIASQIMVELEKI
jgi:Fe2+ transport system protein FeoA